MRKAITGQRNDTQIYWESESPSQGYIDSELQSSFISILGMKFLNISTMFPGNIDAVRAAFCMISKLYGKESRTLNPV